MQTSQPQPAEIDRRRLLEGVALGAGLGAGAAAALPTLAAGEAAADAATAGDPRAALYRESSNVKAYYDSIRY